jgi:hypothetical protein
VNLVEAIRRRFAPLGGVELELPPRELAAEPPTFDPSSWALKPVGPSSSLLSA